MSVNPFEVALLAARQMERIGIPYVIVGSAASSLQGEPRATLDVDFTIRLRANEVGLLCTALEKEFHVDREAFREAVRTRLPCNAIHRIHHVKLDFYVCPDLGIHAEERKRARRLRLTKEPDSDANVASPEDTVLQKLAWYRASSGVLTRQLEDVVGVLKQQGAALDLAYLKATADRLGLSDLLDASLKAAGLSAQ